MQEEKRRRGRPPKFRNVWGKNSPYNRIIQQKHINGDTDRSAKFDHETLFGKPAITRDLKENTNEPPTIIYPIVSVPLVADPKALLCYACSVQPEPEECLVRALPCEATATGCKKNVKLQSSNNFKHQRNPFSDYMDEANIQRFSVRPVDSDTTELSDAVNYCNSTDINCTLCSNSQRFITNSYAQSFVKNYSERYNEYTTYEISKNIIAPSEQAEALDLTSRNKSSQENNPLSDALNKECSPQEWDKQDVKSWTVANVVAFVTSLPGCSLYGENFQDHLIDGETLLQLSEDHMMRHLHMKLGPSLRLRIAIQNLHCPSHAT